ncbi:MAG: hypothetical protein H0W69_11245 [Gemmatimonadaceae bacterium]|nr:hypothetical protein [Gemmatimonadaceae bacterium]
MKKLFDEKLARESRGLRMVRQSILAVAAVHFALAAMSGYRAWVQVQDLRIHLADEILGPGSRIEVDVKTSGRNPVTVALEAVQGKSVLALASVIAPDNGNGFYDPRSQRRKFIAVMTPTILKQLVNGQLLLRARAEGRSQFLRIPPPTVVVQSTFLSLTEATHADVARADDDTMCIAAKIGLPCG